jgi:ubiquinone/menaquinone biosynthesis C-methylase UbiE
LLKTIHPEGIPFPGTKIYNILSATAIFQRHYELLAKDILSYCSQGNVLDIGTGPGWLLLALGKLCPSLKLTGLDVSSSMVAYARQNVAKSGASDIIDIVEGSASKLPFPDESFDAVVSTGTIHHWKFPIAGLNETYRVLKCGRYALMYDLVSDTPKSIITQMAKEFGRLKMLLLWLHSFEEPFYTQGNFELLAQSTLFNVGHSKFVGVLCCLILKKEASDALNDENLLKSCVRDKLVRIEVNFKTK